ncbi:hypothetical protein H9L15_03475 [Sphingomonas daechungensis]|uniref:Uncharacterized protein n=1 Tax=Sphingomonas daechungensis TaxID=1176646 RepID=A0ABX6T3E7_9SPHN|nr:hypothetical protein [Sphingomonas daechungensis]QNP43738.1 hypothetical protein H9L15_03475 [Sphingomonas daechungensis]
MADNLTLAYEFTNDPNDDFGWLAASVEASGFRARNGFWVQWQDLVEFASRLAPYPLPTNGPVEAEWGYSENGEYTRVTLISLSQTSATGKVSVSVDLADYYEPRRRCQVIFDTSYASLELFRQELEDLMARKKETAVLLSA